MLDLANIAPPPAILGVDKDVDWISIVVVVAIMIGAGIVNIIKKAMARADEKRSRQSIDQASQQAEQPKPMRPDEGLARTVRRSMGLPDQPPPLQDEDTGWIHVAAPVTVEPPLREDAPPKAQLAQPAQPAQKKRKKLEKSLGSMAQTAEAPQTAQAVPVPAAMLHDLDSARMAILHYEILAPPKALRNKPEMWEL